MRQGAFCSPDRVKVEPPRQNPQGWVHWWRCPGHLVGQPAGHRPGHPTGQPAGRDHTPNPSYTLRHTRLVLQNRPPIT